MFNLNAEEVAAVAALSQVVIAFVGVVIGVIVPLFIYFGTKKIAKAQYFQTLSTSWAAIDSTVLLHEENLRAINALFHGQEDQADSLELARKRMLGYMFLNPLEIAFNGVRRGFLDAAMQVNIDRYLAYLVSDDDVYSLTQNAIYQPAFAAHCRTIKGKSDSRDKAIPLSGAA